MNNHPQRIIDTHFHIWDVNQLYYPWLSDRYQPNTFMGDYSKLCQNHVLADFQKEVSNFELIAGVHIEAEHDRNNIYAELDWLKQQEKNSNFKMAYVAYAPLLHDEINSILERLNTYQGIRGIRFKPETSAHYNAERPKGKASLHDPKLAQNLAILADYNWVWDARVPYWHLNELSDLAARIPQLSIVLEHTGLPWDRDQKGLMRWAEGMQQLAQCPNVTVKLSELSTANQQWRWQENIELMRNVIQWFGIHRCMFASNYPVANLSITYDGLIKAAQEALSHLSTKERDLFFIENAMRIYRIKI